MDKNKLSQVFVRQCLGVIGDVYDIATIAGASAKNVYKWLNGVSAPNGESVIRLYSYLLKNHPDVLSKIRLPDSNEWGSF